MTIEAVSSLGTDYFFLDDLLTEEERDVRDRVRSFCDKDLIPIINDYWEREEFPFELLPKIGALNIAGTTLEGYGCPKMSATAAGLVSRELARGDGGLTTFFAVHSGVAMTSIATLGSEEQKERWLPPMARMEKIGAFGLTESQHGSDAGLLETTARREGDEYVIDGEKRWIGNASFADVTVIWAREENDKLAAFLVEKGTPGLEATVMTGKTSQRTVLNTDVKLARMLADITAMQTLCFRLSQLRAEGRMTIAMASLAKMHNAKRAYQVVADARDILGGNGVLLEYHVARHLADMQAVYTYDGTDSVLALIVGRDITGYQAFS